MADPRFFNVADPITLGRLAEIAGASLAEGADPDRTIVDVAPLETAAPDQISFLENKKYLSALAETRAGACLVHPAFVERVPQATVALACDAPYRGYALVAQAFYPRQGNTPGVAPTALVDPSAIVDATVEIGPGVIVGAGAEIGADCRIDANAVIGPGVVLGAGSSVGACASLSHCLIGQRVAIYPGARIGQDGFGFAMGAGGHVRIPQTGRVIIEDDVEIGANVTIDRGATQDTVIRRGAMIDNLVQIGHNVEVGAGSVIVAQSGIAGSTKLGEFVVLAAQTGLAGHLKIGAGAKLAASSGVMRDIPPGEEWGGTPAMPIRKFWRHYTRLMKLLDEKG